MDEENLISSLLQKDAPFEEVAELGITPDSFTDHRLRLIFETMQNLRQRVGNFDCALICSELNVQKKMNVIGSRVFVFDLFDVVPTASFTKDYAAGVKRAEKIRNAKMFGRQLADAESAEDVEKVFSQLMSKSTQSKGERSYEEYLMAVLEEEAEGKTRGIDTGFEQLDRMTVGLRAGHLWVVGGLYGVGKTTLVLDILCRIAEEHRAFFYSLEMSGEELLRKIYWMQKCALKDQNKAIDATAKFKNKISVYTKKNSLNEIKAHLLSQKEKPKVVFIDYLQLLNAEGKDEYQRTTNVARGLKNLAVQTDVCVVVISQVSHESANKSLKTIGFRGGGEIAAASDVAIILSRGEETEGIDEVEITCAIRKNRHGRSGEFALGFDKRTGTIF